MVSTPQTLNAALHQVFCATFQPDDENGVSHEFGSNLNSPHCSWEFFGVA
jgi:hypothetical protein